MNIAVPPPVREPGPMRCTAVIRNYQKAWFQELRRKVIEEGQPYAIAEAVSPHEILESFDMPYVTSEWWSGIVASRRQSAYYFDNLNAAGYHDGLPRYGALALATAIAPPEHEAPWGGLPKAALIVGNLGVTPSQPPADLDAFLRGEVEKWGKAVRDANIHID